jgi:hypothetical protein
MSLNLSTIITELKKIFDKEYTGFEGFPSSIEDASIRWATAIDTYAGTNIIPPSNSYNQAKNSFKNILLTLSLNTNGENTIKNAFDNYASIIASGMTGYISIPPPVQIDFTQAFLIGKNGGSSNDVANSMGNIIHNWFKTGLATPIGGGPTINWS